MLPLLAIPIVAGAVIGAFADKKKPLRGAALGAAAGATGGGLLGVGAGAAAAGGAGAAGAGAAGAGAAGAGAAGAGAGSGVGFGLGQSLAAGSAGSATMAGGSAAAAPSAGLLSTLGTQAGQFATNAKPFVDAASTGMSAVGLLGGGQGQQQAPQMQPMGGTSGPQTLGQLAQGAQDPLVARRQAMMAQHRTMWG